MLGFDSILFLLVHSFDDVIGSIPPGKGQVSNFMPIFFVVRFLEIFLLQGIANSCANVRVNCCELLWIFQMRKTENFLQSLYTVKTRV